MAEKPPTVVDLTWVGDLQFTTVTKASRLTLDAKGIAGPSPTDALAAAIAGCMAMDVTAMLVRGRHPLRALRTQLAADRATEHPQRFVAIALRFTIEGAVPAAAIERAIRLSREKYCPVWNSLRQDIDFKVSFDLIA